MNEPRPEAVSDGRIGIGPGHPLLVVAGLCVLEDLDTTLRHAAELCASLDDLPVTLVFKSSYDKANRSSAGSYRGPGMSEGLRILAEVKAKTGLPILTDVHEPAQCAAVAEVADILQVPAFLCRQTDLVVAAGAAGRIVNIKKGQFLAPWDMLGVIEKVRQTGNARVTVTERGVSFGYNTLVNDFRALPIIRQMGTPVIFDATHSVQQPGGLGSRSGGDRTMVPYLARAAAAVGVDGLFFEVHEDPEKARSDGPNSLYLQDLRPILEQVIAIREVLGAV